MIKTLSDAVTIVEFLMSRQGKSVDDAIKEVDVPLHLREQVVKYFAPPLDIVAPDLIVDNKQQLPKCDPENDSTQQRFGSLQRFLIDVRERPKTIVGSLSESSLSIVRRFPKPDAADKFQVRGLVLGYIQSGKTASMAALISRAADEGYKLFIVLGGLWKDLRSQTQTRLDQEIAGYSDEPKEGPYVEYDTGLPQWVRLTRSGLDGDFTSGGPNDLNPLTPKLAIIKKNKKIEALTEWLKKAPVPLKDLPALVIDDEADQASIDTNYGRTDDDGEPIDPSATNRRVRDLLRALPKCVYIGYTATPFANVLIDASGEEDLYPRDFIVSLPEPADYYGPRRLFGLGLEPSDLSPSSAEKPTLDVIRHVKDSELDQLDQALELQGDCPEVLSKALLAFLLSCCGRMARNQGKQHFSMLVHPSQKTEPHRIFADAIRKELDYLKGAATYPKKFPDLLKRAKEMWDDDFRRVTRSQNDQELPEYDFEIIWKFAKSILNEIEIKVLNIYSEDEIDYKLGTARRYIVVGGNRLSRGLTLEGLSVSVFTRNANQYDTLLQMGRWFGYRPQYADLTRIYVDKDMADRFAELARVEDELRADIKKYAQEPDPPTPLELKPIIRTHPALAITSRAKMGAGRPVQISFQNTSSETITFPIDRKDFLEKNLNAGRALISHLEKTAHVKPVNGTYIWKDLPASVILDFLNVYEFSRNAREVDRISLTNYIKRQNEKGELSSWDIVLPRGNQNIEPYSWGKDIFTHKIQRSPYTAISVRQLKSPSDLDFWRTETGRDPKDPMHGAMVLYLVDKNSESPEGRKFFSDPSAAEDLLGMVFVFPESKSNATVEYVSQ
jgi:hypothetical protein